MLEEIKIENLIYEIRGKQVMLDSDVARLYGYETKRINEIVKRNIERFPEEFCFQITNKEINEVISLRSQFATLKKGRGQHQKYLPYAFTEHGVMMLAGMLKSEIAVEISKKIINAFVAIRHFIKENKDIFKRLPTVEYKMLEYNENFEKIFNALEPKKLENQKNFLMEKYMIVIV